MGTIILVVLCFLIVLSVRNPTYTKQLLVGVGQTMKGVVNGAKTASGNNLKWVWSLLIVIIGVCAAYWSYHNSLHPADIGNWGYEKWLALVVVWIVAEILIAVNFDDEKKAAKFRTILRWTMPILLIVLPIWSWVASLSAAKPQDCPLFSSTKTHQCPITEAGLVLSLSESIRPGEFEFCYIKPEEASMQSNWVGPTALKVRSTKGTFVLVYKMIKRENLIDGKCPEKL